MPVDATPRRSVSRQVLTDYVYEDLLISLMDGRLEPGAPVSIDGMARELDVSPTPVREALARLESTGLVTRVALKGYRVAPLLTTAEMGLLMDARQVIEPANAEKACEYSDAKFRLELQQTVTDLRNSLKAPAGSEFRLYWEADERFHRLIAEHAGNPFLLAAYDALGGQVQRFRFFGGHGVTDSQFAIAEHTKIVDAFEAGDSDAARETMLAHIMKVKERATLDSAAVH